MEVGEKVESKIRAFGPGLEGGMSNLPCDFTVETNGEIGALGRIYIFLFAHHRTGKNSTVLPKLRQTHKTGGDCYWSYVNFLAGLFDVHFCPTGRVQRGIGDIVVGGRGIFGSGDAILILPDFHIVRYGIEIGSRIFGPDWQVLIEMLACVSESGSDPHSEGCGGHVGIPGRDCITTGWIEKSAGHEADAHAEDNNETGEDEDSRCVTPFQSQMGIEHDEIGWWSRGGSCRRIGDWRLRTGRGLRGAYSKGQKEKNVRIEE